MSTKTAITVTRQTKGQITDVLVGVFTCGFHLLCCPFSRLIISIKHNGSVPLKVKMMDGSGGVREEFVIPPGKTYRQEVPYKPENMDLFKGSADPWKFEFEDGREFTVNRAGGSVSATIS